MYILTVLRIIVAHITLSLSPGPKRRTTTTITVLPDLPEMVSATAARTTPSTRARGQDDGSQTPSNQLRKNPVQLKLFGEQYFCSIGLQIHVKIHGSLRVVFNLREKTIFLQHGRLWKAMETVRDPGAGESANPSRNYLNPFSET